MNAESPGETLEQEQQLFCGGLVPEAQLYGAYTHVQGESTHILELVSELHLVQSGYSKSIY